MKFVKFLILALALMASCAPKEPPPQPSVYQQIQQRLTDLQTYRAHASVEYISNKGSNTYETIQHGKITGEYRIEIVGPEHVAGNVTSFDGQHIYQYSSRVNGRVIILARESQERSEIFLSSFIKNWLAGQESSVTVTNMGEGQYTVLEATIPGDHPYLTSQKLWVSNETLLPTKLIIYDPNNNERVIVTYHNFEYNIELENGLFAI